MVSVRDQLEGKGKGKKGKNKEERWARTPRRPISFCNLLLYD